MDARINKCDRNKNYQEIEFVMERNRNKVKWENKFKQMDHLGLKDL